MSAASTPKLLAHIPATPPEPGLDHREGTLPGETASIAFHPELVGLPHLNRPEGQRKPLSRTLPLRCLPNPEGFK